MLLCLVALPLVALRGTTWTELTKTIPEIAKRVLNSRWNSSLGLANDSPRAPETCQPANGPSAKTVPQTSASPVAVTGDAPPLPGPIMATAGVTPHRTLPSPFDGVIENSPRSPTDRASRLPTFASQTGAPDQLPADAGPRVPRRLGPLGLEEGQVESPGRRLGWQQPEPEGLRSQEDHRSPGTEGADARRTPLVPVARRDHSWAAGSQPEAPPLQNAVIRPDPQPMERADPSDRFTYVLDRLRELGATYYLLETWGNEGQRFRFHCKLAVGGTPSFPRHFEATDRDALQAMARVLGEVEAWRASR